MSKQNLSINILEPVGGHGGMNYYNSGLCRGLVNNGEKVSLYTCNETTEVSEDGFSISKFFVNIYGDGNKLVRAFNFLNGLVKSIRGISLKNGKFCHVHFFHYGVLELITCVLLRMAGLSIIATIHDVESFSQGKLGFLNKLILKMCSHFVVHNEFSKKELGRILNEMKLKKPTSVIPHGNYISFVDEKNKEDARSNLGLPSDKKVLLFFGQIKDVKGLEILIDSFAKLKKTNEAAVLLIAGKVWKTDFSQYEKQIASLGLTGEDVISHIKYIPDELVGDYYAAADIVVLPYKRIYQSGVLLMSMSYGKVVVTSDLEPMLEVINDGGNGFVFKSEDSIDLCDILDKALQEDLVGIGKNAKSAMKEDFSWDLIAKKHLEVYEKYTK